MNGTFFQAETVEAPVRGVNIRFEKSFAPPPPGDSVEDPLSIFEEFVNRHLAKGYLHFTLDVGNIPFPTTRLIALLIAMTVRVRRRQGDVKLINVSSSARNNFSTFSALNFLTINHDVAPANPSATVIPPAAASPRSRRPNLTPAATPGEINHSPFERNTPATAATPLSQTRILDTDTLTLPPIAVQRTSGPAPAPPNPGLEDDVAGLTEIAEPPLVEEIVHQIEATPTTTEEKKFQLRVESRTSNLYQLCDFVTAHAFAAGLQEKEIAKMKIAVYEACLNVIEHAYHSHPDEWIDLRVRYSPERFMIIIQDHGLSFEMKPPKDYDVQEVIDERRSGGFGLHIIRRAMDSVEYLPDIVNGNRLVMIKRLP